jgi:integrase
VACVVRRRGRWVVDYRDALGDRRWITCDTRAQADETLAKVLREARQIALPVVDPDVTVQAYSERWLRLIAPTIKPRTLEGYEEKLRNHLLPLLGDRRVRQLHRGAIKSLLSEKLTSGLSTESVRLIHGTLRAMLSAAVEDGVVLANLATGLGRVLRLVRSRSSRQESIKALDANQEAAFLAAVLEHEPRFYPPFLLLARTGLRLGEALALQWDDVDLLGRELRVERALSNRGQIDTPKSGHGRTVDLSTRLVGTLRELDAESKAVALAHGWPRPIWLFAAGTGTPYDHANVAKAFKRALKAAGLPAHFHVHCLRHTYASRLLADGASPAYVQEQLGHASIELTVRTYGRWLRKRAPGAVDRLDGVLPEDGGSKVVANALAKAAEPDVRPPQVVSPQRKEMVRPGRFERPTYRFVVCCSIQLS